MTLSVDRIQGLSGSLAIKRPVACATTANITLNGLQTIDGFVLASGDRVLVKNQTTGSENGVYEADTSDWRRTLDFDKSNDVVHGTLVNVIGGSTNYGFWILNTPAPVVGTSSLVFGRFEGFEGSDQVVYVPAGTGAVATTAQAKLRESTSVEDFGATGDGVSDDTAEIQAAIDAVAALGGGEVLFSKALYLSQKLTLPSNVILRGKGSAYTTIKLKNGSNTALIETEDFSTLTGSNSWFVDTEGVPYGFGVVGMTLDGNKANQTAGNGVSVYGKRYLVSDVVVKDAYGVGWYTECAYKGGQHDWRDMPEGRIEGLYVHLSGGHGLQVRGPHDLFIASAFVSQAQGDGVRVEGLLNVYQGNSDIGLIHSYGNVGMGFYCNTLVNADVIIGETNAKEGVVFDEGSGISTCSVIRAFGNDYASTGLYYNVRLATGIQAGTIHCLDNTYQSAGGISLAGNQIQIGTLNVLSTIAHNGKGIHSPGAANVDIGSAIVEGYSGATGVGVSITSMTRCSIDAYVTNCKTLYAMAAVGNGNTFTFRGLSGVGQTQYSGVADYVGNNSVKHLFSDGSAVTSKEWLPRNAILYPPAASTPAENGEMTFELTSATELKIKVKSGGTVRAASIALS